MNRVADLTHFRAAGVTIDWYALRKLRRDFEDHREPTPPQTRLAWSCSTELGVPRAPFRVFAAFRRDPETKPIHFDKHRTDEGWHVYWDGTEAAVVQVTCEPYNPTAPMGVFALRTGHTSENALAVARFEPGGPGQYQLEVRAAAATSVVLVNAEPVEVAIAPLQDLLDWGGWKELEVVGLPVEGGLRDYDTQPQGLAWAPTSPVDAALERLLRAQPAAGWWPSTETGRAAPPWQPPDHPRLVKAIQTDLFPRVEPLFDAGRPEHAQGQFVATQSVEGPSQGSRLSTQPATATLAPLHALLLAAGGDAFTNLAMGFGTGYRATELKELARGGTVEFLVTAQYRECVVGTDVEVCAYVPAPTAHTLVPGVVDLTADRAALVTPSARDLPFAESIELSWLPRQGRPWLTDPIAVSVARFDPTTGAAAVDALPPRDDGGSGIRTLPRPDRIDGHPGSERPRYVDPGLPLPPSGPIHRGYAVAQANVFGIYSAWQDIDLVTSAPDVTGARVVTVELATEYAGSPVCASTLTVELAVPWVERTPTSVDLVALYYPMPGGSTPPPGVQPWQPAGGHARVSVPLAFSGDALLAPGGTVAYVGPNGDAVAAGAAQGQEGRRYRVELPGQPLDFGVASRWGVRVWLRLHAQGVGVPSAWTPRPDSPAIAVAASPVPVAPQPPPRLPGVPLGSTLDPEGCSHVRVTWQPISAPNLHRIVVWETTETALLWKLEGSEPAEDDVPGARLQRLFDVYDAVAGDAKAAATRRQSCFRRVMELEPSATSADVTLPRGSRDIHLYVVTGLTTTGIESDWPAASGGTLASAHLQPVMAPRLVRPAPPEARSTVLADGTTQVALRSASGIDLSAFEVFATRSEAAARDALTMGPPRASVAVIVPPIDPDTGEPARERDVITGVPLYEGTWVGGLPEHWDPWFVRAVAVPQATVPELAQRGLVSKASDVVQVSVRPSGPPVLDPLTYDLYGGDPLQVRIRTATTAPRHLVAAGPFRLDASVAGMSMAPSELHLVVAGDGSVMPAGVPAFEQLPRAAGSTPLVLWASRALPGDAITVSVTLADPVGRATTRTLVVPGYVEPAAAPSIDITDVFVITGRGTVVRATTPGEPDDVPPWTITLAASAPATGPILPFPPPIPPIRPVPPIRPIGPMGVRPRDRIRFPFDPLPGRRRESWTGSWALADIRDGALAGGRRGAVEVSRSALRGGGTELSLFLPSTKVDRIQLTISSDAGSASDTWSR